MNRSAGQTNRVNREAVLEWFVCSALRFIPPWTQKKRHSFLIFTMFLTRTLSKILREKLLIQNSNSNGHLTLFDVLITAQVIRPNRRTFCWLCSSGIELKIFSRVQRRKYDTIVNIMELPILREFNYATCIKEGNWIDEELWLGKSINCNITVSHKRMVTS